VDIDGQIPSNVNFKYYSNEDFHDDPQIQEIINEKSLSVLHCNIRSLSANHNKLSVMLSELGCPFSLIAFSETKIKYGENLITNADIPGYTFVSQPSLSNAGSVGLFVKNDLKYTIRNDLSTSENDFETLWVDLNNHGQNIICGVVYRHPKHNFENFTKYLYKILDQIQNSNKMCIILGDFNINLLNSDFHRPTEDFINNMFTYFMNPQIIQPTRITDHTATLIDNIFLNSIEYDTMSGNLLTDITDHLPNFLIINRISTFKKENISYKRNYTKINQERIINEVKSINWDNSLLDCGNPNDIFDSIYDN
jgi:exonuclease III